MQNEIAGYHGMGECQHNPLSGVLFVAHILYEAFCFLCFVIGSVCKSLGNLIVHSSTSIVQIGVHRDNTDVVLDGLPYNTLHIGSITHLLQPTEQQGVMAHHHVASFLYGLGNDCLSDVQTQ